MCLSRAYTYTDRLHDDGDLTDPTSLLAPTDPTHCWPHPLQIYNEQIKDLLIPSGPLSMRDDRGTLVVHGLSLHKVRLCECE